MSDYWLETVEIALADAGISATKEQIEVVAGAIEVSAENEGVAFGHHAIPSPLEGPKDAEIARLKRELKQAVDDIAVYRGSVAQRRGVPDDHVYLENGRVVFDRV